MSSSSLDKNGVPLTELCVEALPEDGDWSYLVLLALFWKLDLACVTALENVDRSLSSVKEQLYII
jgi:hypothetical protein